MSLDDFVNDYERAEHLQHLLVTHATGGKADQSDYQSLRRFFLDNTNTKTLVPRFVRTSRDLFQFWEYIKAKFAHYSERREFLWNEFRPLLDYLEAGSAPSEEPISEVLHNFNQETIHRAWTRALERKAGDPEGAITVARTLLESVCKHILDEGGMQYSKNIELHQLYSITAKQLKLSPDQHNEKIFKQILGGCSGIVSGLGALRNSLGDAHGTGKTGVRPAARHAELAVNLAGAVAVFLITTYQENFRAKS